MSRTRWSRCPRARHDIISDRGDVISRHAEPILAALRDEVRAG
jgi:hypothetical protein